MDTVRECDNLIEKLQADEGRQHGFEDDEIKMCLMFASSMFRLASRRGWNLHRQCAQVRAMLATRLAPTVEARTDGVTVERLL